MFLLLGSYIKLLVTLETSPSKTIKEEYIPLKDLLRNHRIGFISPHLAVY